MPLDFLAGRRVTLRRGILERSSKNEVGKVQERYVLGSRFVFLFGFSMLVAVELTKGRQ